MNGLLRASIRCLLICALFFGVLISSHAQTSPEVTKGVQWLHSQVQGDGSLLNEPQSIATTLQNRTEAAITLKLLANLPSSLTDAIAAEPENNTEYLARRIVSLAAAGRTVAPLFDQLSSRQNPNGGFGGALDYESNSLDTAWALIAMQAARQTTGASAALNYLQSAQQADGSYVAGRRSDLYTSATALTALRLYASTHALQGNIQLLTAYLISQQTAPGNWGNAAWLTAVVYQAVHDFIPLEPTGEAVRNYLVASQQLEGSWNADPYVTAVVLRALILTVVAPVNPTKAIIQAKVIDGQTGLPAMGVTITLSGTMNATRTTEADGAFIFNDLLPGAYNLTASLANYGTLVTSTGVQAGQTIDLGVLKLTKASGTTGTIYGMATDKATGNPLKGVTISADGLTALTDAGGMYQIINVPAGTVTLSSSKTGYVTVNGTGKIFAGGTLLYSPALSTTTTNIENKSDVTGIVLDAGTSHPLIGVNMTVTDGEGSRTFTSGADGRFTLLNVLGDANGGAKLEFSLAQYVASTTYVVIDGSTMIDIGQVRLRKEQATSLLPDLKIQSVGRMGYATHPQTLTLSGQLTVEIANEGTAGAPAGVTVLTFHDANRNGIYDAGIDQVLGQSSVNSEIGAGTAASVTISLGGKLPFRDAPIHLWVDSAQSIVELNEGNNVGNSCAACEVKPSIGTLQPKLKWAWSGSPILPTYNQVMMMPIVIPLQDTNDDGKVDQNDMPAVVFSTFAGSNYTSNGVLRAISGKDGRELWTVTNPAYRVHPGASIAAADLDGDGFVEIIAPTSDDYVIAFNHKGEFKWRSQIKSPGGSLPSIADIDGDGKAEIIIGNSVLNFDGTVRFQPGGAHGIVADINLDGKPELIMSAYVFSNTGSLLWYNNTIGGAFSGVGNFNQDPYPEIVFVSQGRVFLVDHLGSVIWGPVALPGGGHGGTPTIADMDGDGIPEIGVAGARFYTVFKADGTILWSSPTQDISSSATGSSVFDFDGDGNAEVVYADERYLRVYRGKTGAVLYQVPNSSGTIYELPVIVDVDNDNHADIVVATNNYAFGSNGTGIRVYSDANNSWVNTRKIWNQHSYHITNINDDGTVPRVEQNSWQTHNSYRLNAFPDGSATAVPDLTASFLRIQDGGGITPSTFTVRVGNGGMLPTNPGATVAFYNGKPGAGGILLGTAKTVTTLASGQFEDVVFAYANGLSGIAELVAVVDDDGTGKGALAECDETNNAVSMLLSALPGSFGLTVSTNAPEYAANTDVQISATIVNHGSFDGIAQVRFVIETAGGEEVAILPVQSISVPKGGQATAGAVWNTGTILTGAYQIKAQLVDANGVPYAEASIAFAINAGSSSTLSGKITTDKQLYLPSEVVKLSDRIANVTANALLSDLRVVTKVINPDGSQRFTTTETIPQLLAGALKDYTYSVPLHFGAAGQYSATLTVTAADNTVLAQASTVFAVASSADTGSGLSGTIAALPKQVPQGEVVAFAVSANNAGNGTLANLPLKVTIVDPAAQIIMAEYPAAPTLEKGTPYNAGVSWTTRGAVGTTYVAVLTAEIGGKTLTLAQDSFTLIAPPIKLAITQVLSNGSRVLALVSCKDGESDTDKDGKPAVCITQRTQTIAQSLTALGVTHHITTHETAFRQALRSGLYNTLWISGKQDKLHGNLAAEVREAVFSGDGMILDGEHDQRNKTLDTVAGITWQGKIGETDLPVVLAGPIFNARQLHTVGRGLKPELIGSVAHAAFNGIKGQSEGPAIVTHAYGAGHAMTFAFDLPASLQAQPQWQPVLGASLQHVLPVPPATFTPGAVLPVKTSIVNQANAVAVEIKSTLPAGSAYQGSSPAGNYHADTNLIGWTFNLDPAQSRDVYLTIRAPATAGDSALHTTVSTVKSGIATPYGHTLTLPMTVTAAATHRDTVIAALKALQLSDGKQQKLRDDLVAEIQGAMAAFQQNTAAGYEAAIGKLIGVIDRLNELAGVERRAIHDGIGRIIREAQWRWSLAPAAPK